MIKKMINKNTYLNRHLSYGRYRNKMSSISLLPVNKQFSHHSKKQSPMSLRNMVLKNELDKQMQNIDNNSSEKNIIQKQIVDYIDSKKSTMSDLAKIEPAKKAVEKMSNNETPLKKEFTAYSHLKNEYEELLLSDSESDNESESSFHEPATSNTVDTSDSNKVSTREEKKQEKLNDLKTYLSGELKSVTSSSDRLKKLFNKLGVEENEKKRKIEESSDKDSSIVLGQSKKSRQSVHDYVEDLPTDYNPSDDIGTD